MRRPHATAEPLEVLFASPPPYDDPDDQPVSIEGEPLSESMIRERREVAAFFFDTSALVKRHVTEVGKRPSRRSRWCRRIRRSMTPPRRRVWPSNIHGRASLSRQPGTTSHTETPSALPDPASRCQTEFQVKLGTRSDSKVTPGLVCAWRILSGGFTTHSGPAWRFAGLGPAFPYACRTNRLRRRFRRTPPRGLMAQVRS